MNRQQIATDATNSSFLLLNEGDIDFSSIENEFRQDAPHNTYLDSIASTIQQEEKATATNAFDNLEPIPLEAIDHVTDDEDGDRPIEAFPDNDIYQTDDAILQRQPASSHSVVSFTSSSSDDDFRPTVSAIRLPTRHGGDAAEPFPSMQDMEKIFSESPFSIEDFDRKNSRRFRDYQKEKWWTRYNELTHVFLETGRSAVHHADDSRKGLARWIKRQRAQYKLRNEGKPSSMTDERIDALQQINFVWDSHSSAWEDRIVELSAFKAEHGHCSVSSSNCPLNKTLVSWVKCQRRQYRLVREGKKSNLTEKRVRQLEKLGFRFC